MPNLAADRAARLFLCPALSFTTKAASVSSTEHGGGNRRLAISQIYANIRNCELRAVLYLGRMGTYGFIYRCPTIGHKVQGFVRDNPPAPDDTVYEAVTCTACYRVHLVNPSSGHVAGTNRSMPKP